VEWFLLKPILGIIVKKDVNPAFVSSLIWICSKIAPVTNVLLLSITRGNEKSMLVLKTGEVASELSN